MHRIQLWYYLGKDLKGDNRMEKQYFDLMQFFEGYVATIEE